MLVIFSVFFFFFLRNITFVVNRIRSFRIKMFGFVFVDGKAHVRRIFIVELFVVVVKHLMDALSVIMVLMHSHLAGCNWAGFFADGVAETLLPVSRHHDVSSTAPQTDLTQTLHCSPLATLLRLLIPWKAYLLLTDADLLFMHTVIHLAQVLL